jgi:uncharacterized protein (TIGR03435 family)
MKRVIGISRIMLAAGAGLAVWTVSPGPLSPVPACAQSAGSAAQAETPAPQSFEVASIKPSAAQGGMMIKMQIGTSPGGRYTATGVTVRMLIQQAYDLKDYQISGAPGWLSTERYDIVAKAETPNISREQLRVLLQSLLAERFNLKVRRETKELPIYALVVAKDGPKMPKSENQPGPGTDPQPPGVSKTGEAGAAPPIKMAGTGGAPIILSGVGPGGAGGMTAAGGGGGGGSIAVMSTSAGGKGNAVMKMGPGQINAKGAPMSFLVSLLTMQLGRPVLDKTGLEGNYDITLQYAPDETQRGLTVGAPEAPPSADIGGPSIFTALQDQLGLKLEAQKGPVEILVIEHVDRPSPD